MLPTFVIGLREGLEASLIVGIIAAFLSRQGRRDLLRWVYLGVGTAVLLCIAVGVILEAVSANLPQRQQEGLETVVGVLAVGMVTYMVVWMKQHSRELKKQLEGLAAEAMNDGGRRAGRAMVIMAFLAVLREGFETVVFLLAAFNEDNGGTADAAGGAVAGIALAVLLGYGIYRGGVKLNLSKFFRGTGIVLVLVAAGLVVTALHTAHEAGWLNAGQGSTVDLTWLVRPGSVQSALLTGMLGVQEHPVVIEVVGWLAYLLPVGVFVAWPPNRPIARRTLVRLTSALAGLGVVAAALLFALAPATPAADPATAAGTFSARLAAAPATTAVVRTAPQSPAAGTDTTTASAAATSATSSITVHRTGSAQHAGVATDVYTASVPGTSAAGRPTKLTYEQVAALNGGRLPLGVRTTDASAEVQVQYTDTDVLTVWIEPRTGRVVDLRWNETVLATLTGTQVGTVPLDQPVATAAAAMPAADSAVAGSAAQADLTALGRRSGYTEGVEAAVAVAVLAALGLVGLVLTGRRKQATAAVTQITRTPSRTTAD
ncbi:FTR1 family protein [Actinospica durhamensis]|uniref:FTR1 family protein n=1 Tax=Actinospica durhamensis TaxID=1508375 RepID=A0A941EYG3_9ACTN|nr:iron uptake transporter permease EfeU [Actinospica durhamensis]MBR7836314.1 FTR1 family protein [Actinospica durhamensis]